MRTSAPWPQEEHNLEVRFLHGLRKLPVGLKRSVRSSLGSSLPCLSSLLLRQLSWLHVANFSSLSTYLRVSFGGTQSQGDETSSYTIHGVSS